MAHVDHVAIAERAKRQLGLITGAQLAELGLTYRQVEGMHSRGFLRRLRRGVFALSSAPETPKQHLLAATLSLDEAVASHRSAAWLWRFDGIEADEVELSVPRHRRGNLGDGVVHRVTDLDAVDVTTIGPQPVTTPARTLIDLAPVLPEPALEEALDGACRRGQVRVDFLRWRIDALRRRGRAGVALLVALLETPDRDRPESWLESAFLRLLREHFLPVPRLQVTMQPGPGRRVRLDGLYDEERLAVEVSGHATHATRRQRQADGERRARLVAEGFRVVDFTYEDVVERPAYVAGTIAGLLGVAIAERSS